MKSIAALIAFLTCTVVFATSPCPPDATCENGFAVAVAASLVAIQSACARIDPPRKEQYSEAMEKWLNMESAEDRETLRKAKSSPLFNDELKKAERRIEQMQSAELKSLCASLLTGTTMADPAKPASAP